MVLKHRTFRVDEEIDAAIMSLMKRDRRSWSNAANYLLALAIKTLKAQK